MANIGRYLKTAMLGGVFMLAMIGSFSILSSDAEACINDDGSISAPPSAPAGVTVTVIDDAPTVELHWEPVTLTRKDAHGNQTYLYNRCSEADGSPEEPPYTDLTWYVVERQSDLEPTEWDIVHYGPSSEYMFDWATELGWRDQDIAHDRSYRYRVRTIMTLPPDLTYPSLEEDSEILNVDTFLPVIEVAVLTTNGYIVGNEVIVVSSQHVNGDIWCSVDNVNWTTCASSTSPGFTFDDITEFSHLADGEFTLYTRASNPAGTTTREDVFTKDASAPTGTVTAYLTDETDETVTILLTLTADDGAGSGVTEMKIGRLADLSDAEWTAFVTTWSVTLEKDGVQNFYVQLRDVVGHESEIYQINVDTGEVIVPEDPEDDDDQPIDPANGQNGEENNGQGGSNESTPRATITYVNGELETFGAQSMTGPAQGIRLGGVAPADADRVFYYLDQYWSGELRLGNETGDVKSFLGTITQALTYGRCYQIQVSLVVDGVEGPLSDAIEYCLPGGSTTGGEGYLGYADYIEYVLNYRFGQDPLYPDEQFAASVQFRNEFQAELGDDLWNRLSLNPRVFLVYFTAYQYGGATVSEVAAEAVLGPFLNMTIPVALTRDEPNFQNKMAEYRAYRNR